MILITTPAGDIGARVLEHVLDAGASVRVIARNPGQLPSDLMQRIQVTQGSHADKAVINQALPGVKGVFWLPPGSPAETSADAAYVEFSRAFCEALPGSDVSHVVGISALGRGWQKPAGQVTASLRMDDMIGATGVNYRALTCASLMDNLLRQADPIRAQGMFFAPSPADLKLPHVAKSDVAAVAARLLLSTDWSGAQEVPLYGPKDLSFNEIAAIMTDVLGKHVHFQEMAMDGFESMMLSNGASEGIAEAYVQMLTAKNEGMDTVHGPAHREDTPTDFRKWCKDELKPVVSE